MKRAAPWVTCLALGLVLAQRESVVHSPDGSLAPLAFGRQTCLRVVQGERALSGTTCVDFESGAGVLNLRLNEGSLEVPYRVEPALGEVSYLIRLGEGWRAASPSLQAAPPAASAQVLAEQSAKPAALDPLTRPAPAGADSLSGSAAPIRPPMADSLRERLLPRESPKAVPPSGQQNAMRPETDSSLLPYFFLRQIQGRYQVAYSLLARAPVDTPASGIRLLLDGKPLSGQLTRRTTASVPGHLERGQAEYGWIDLGPLEGSRLELKWQLGEASLEREWRLP